MNIVVIGAIPLTSNGNLTSGNVKVGPLPNE
jgi:hypothetical protein